MDQNFQELKDLLLQIKSGVTKVGVDVTLLHSKIDAIPVGEAPTQEQWDEIKGIANDIKLSVEAIDLLTPEEDSGGGTSNP